MNESGWFSVRRILRRNVRAEVVDEIAFHIQMRTADLIEQGVEPERARVMAEARFGPVQPIEQVLTNSVRRRRRREDRAEAFMDLSQDLRFAIRSLRRAPAFTTAAITTLALGVGATLAVFNVVNGVLLRPLPYADPSRIQMVWITNTEDNGVTSHLPLSSGFFLDIARQARGFEALAAFRAWQYQLTTDGSVESERLAGARVSPALFSVLGVRPAIGQPFVESDAVSGGPSVAIIGHDLWQRRFGADHSIIGKRLTLNGSSFTVTGVMPQGFSFPRGAELPAPFGFGLRTEVWTPLVFDSSDSQNYGTQNLSAIGRLRGSLTPLAAQSELSGIMKAFLQENAPRLKLDYRVVSMADQAGQTVERGLQILLGAVLLVLVIAAANVASLLVARIATRRRELAVRAALGAGRARISRQLLTENIVLATAGTVLGLVVAYWTTRVMLALVPGSLPRADDIGMDWRVLSFASLVALAAAGGFAIASVLAIRWSRLGSALQEGDRRAAGSVQHRYGRRFLAATEVALSLMLLIGAALLTRSFIALQRVQLGFDSRNVVTAGVSIPIAGRFQPLQDGPRWSATMNEIITRVSSAPGVAAAGMVSGLPLSGAFESGQLRLPGVTYEPGRGPSAQYNVVAGEYFKAAGIKLLTGRAFDASDDPAGRSTIIINRAVARELFGSEAGAIGRQLIAMFEFTRNRPPRTVVGVVDVVKQLSADEEPKGQVYVPVSQMAYPGLTLVVRTNGDAARDMRSLIAMFRREARAVDPAVTIDDVRTMDEVVSLSLARQRFNMTLIGVFAVLALILSIVGLYGVVALIVGQRRREIGVRLALGARPQTVVRMIMREGAAMAAVGVALGIGGALALTRAMASLLYDVTPTDAGTFIGAAFLVTTVALGAAYVPARRAAHVDPRAALAAD